jgi:DNA-binding FadR family transcriptional regulator
MATVGIDVELLHWHLWETRSPKGFVDLTQKELGERLCVSRQRALQVINDLVEQGRIKTTKTRSRYVVNDPALLAGEATGPVDADDPAPEHS